MRHDQIVSKYRSISGFVMRDRSSSEFLLAEAEKGRKEGITNPNRRTPASSSGLFPAEGARGNCSNLKMRGFADRSLFLL